MNSLCNHFARVLLQQAFERHNNAAIKCDGQRCSEAAADRLENSYTAAATRVNSTSFLLESGSEELPVSANSVIALGSTGISTIYKIASLHSTGEGAVRSAQ